MEEQELNPFQRNEIDANKQMIIASVFTAAILIAVQLLYLFLYLTKIYVLSSDIYLLINIFFPINIVFLFSPLLLRKTKFFYTKYFKVYLLFAFLSVIFVLNVLIPKHAVLAWAIPLLLANHYYKPKLTRIVFFVTLALMLISIYMGMFFGEYDDHYLTAGIIKYDAEGLPYLYRPQTAVARWEMLHQLIEETGENRYLNVFIYYYLSRSIVLSILYRISVALSKRTRSLLESEVQVTKDKQQIESELTVAHDIQHNALPGELSSIKDVTIIAELLATKEVGGDLYNYIPLDDSHVAIVIGDVSGKGIPAAMFMMKTITCINAYTSLNKKPSEILKEVNTTIHQGNESMMFVTCFLGILNTKTGVLEFCNAGHNKPLIGKNEDFRYLNCSSGFVLGPLAKVPLKDESIQLDKDEVLFFYTDGITEAMNENSEIFGDNRLLELFNKRSYPTIIDINYELRDSLSAFVGNAKQSDDITYVFVKYQGDDVQTVERTFKADINEMGPCLDFITSILEKHNASKWIGKMSVVMDELFSNIAKYAYPEDVQDGWIYVRVGFNTTKRILIITLVDKGIEFNPLSHHAKKISPHEELKQGGLGLLIVKKTMDSVSYSRINNKNILVVTKKL